MRLAWLAIGVTLIATFSTFGYPLLFDRLLLGLLLVTALVSFKWDKNLFTLCLIFIGEIIIEEAAWFLSDGNRFFLIPSYLYLLIACYITRYSLLGKISSFFAICAISAEVHWFLINKEGPEIFWHTLICANLLLAKHLILVRPHFFSIRFSGRYEEWKITKTDVDAGFVVSFSIIHEFLNLAEYLVRHILGYQAMLIYDTYLYVAQILVSILFFLFLLELSYTVKTKLLTA